MKAHLQPSLLALAISLALAQTSTRAYAQTPAASPTAPASAPTENAMQLAQSTPAATDPTKKPETEVEKKDAEKAQRVAPVVVTGTKQNLSEFQTQQSVDVLTSKKLEERGITTVQEILARSANVSQGDSRGLNIRGSTTLFQVDYVFRPNIAFVRDGVEGNVQSFIELQSLWDVGQVEILKGSQTTAYGRNAIGGAIVINTKDPTDYFETRSRAGVGSFNYRTLSTVVSGPLLNDELTGRFAVDWQGINEQHPNFYYGDTPLKSTVLRGKLAYQPRAVPGLTSKLTVEQTNGSLFDFMQEWEPLTPSADGKLPREAFNYFPAREPRENRNTVVGLDVEYKLNDRWTLESVTGFNRRERVTRSTDNLCYQTFTAPFQPSPQGDCLNFNDRETTRTTSQELRLTRSSPTLDTLFGAFYQRQAIGGNGKITLLDSITLLPTEPEAESFREKFDLEVQSVFGQVLWRFAPKWSLTSAARFTREQTRFAAGEDPEQRITSDKLTPEISLGFEPSKSLALFGTYRQGFRAAGAQFNNSLVRALSAAEEDAGGALLLPPNVQRNGVFTFGPETANTFEAAVRWRSADNRLALNANVFTTTFKNRQEFVLLRATDANGATVDLIDQNFGDRLSYVANAGSSRLRGLETQAEWRPAPAWNVYAAIGLQKGKYLRFNDGDVDLSGQALADFPERTASIGVNYGGVQGWSWGVAANYTSENQRFRDENVIRPSPARTIFDARIAYGWRNWRASLTATNLFNKRYLLEAEFKDPLIRFRGSERQVRAQLEWQY
jgi:iron complex outermembrane recepter protein